MVTRPETHYARSGDVHIAYQTFGHGPALVGVPPFVQNIDALWEDVSGLYPRFLNDMADFCTVTHFDKRGTGLSDRTAGFVGIEERVDDLRAVMDAVGLERAIVGGISEGGPLAMLFAALYPARVEKLMLMGTAARFVNGDDYPYGVDAEVVDALADQLAELWATPESLLVPLWMPSMSDDTAFRNWVTTYERASASPGAVRDAMHYIKSIDVRSVLGSIQAPTLVMHRTDEILVSVEHGRYLAEHIPGAQLVELVGVDHVPWVPDPREWVEEVRLFVTGERRAHLDVDRVLATVLFTDIVGSTEQARTLGDHKWRALLDRHDAAVRRELAAYGGVEVKTTGDGFLATFDSPSRAVRAALAICEAASAAGLTVRAGLHTGEVERRGDDVAGIGVHVGARVAALAGPSEVLTSATVRDLVLGSEFAFEDRGRHTLKGLDGEFQILAASA
jgi:class 3 adenylate cyclase